jgi:uncharacterized protein (DUF433 family)
MPVVESNEQKGRFFMGIPLKGVIRGKLIELEQEPGFTDGQTVTVEIRPLEEKAESSASPSEVPRVETWMHRLVFEPSILPGERIVKGTRLAAEALVQELAAGQTEEGLLKAHPELTQEDISALRNYARTPVGLRRSVGAWAEDAEELDKYLEWTRQQRKIRRREIEE